MTFNFKETGKYAYYFDKKFSKHMIIKPFFHKNRVLISMIVAVVFMVSSLCFFSVRTYEAMELSHLKGFIADFMEVKGMKKLNDHDITVLAKEVKRAGLKYDIDPMLVLSIITVESSFNKDAKSPMGARGLMQLMPGTAKKLCLEMGIEYNDKVFTDIGTNVHIGTYYLSKLSSKYNNNMQLYLAAYNRGPGQVDRMLKENNSIPKSYYSKIVRTYQKFSI